MPAKPYIILWPEQEQCQGIHVGRCINPAHRVSSNHYAHAHGHPRDPFHGWICCRPSQASRLTNDQGELLSLPANKWSSGSVAYYILSNSAAGVLAWHELAHILVRPHSSGHGYPWQSTLASLLMEHMPYLSPAAIRAESYEYHKPALSYDQAAPRQRVLAAGNFLAGQRVRIAADARHAELRGQPARVVKVNRTRLILTWEHPEALPRKLAAYTYWPARLVEPL